MSRQARSALFGGSLERFNGSLPAWYRDIFVADMLFALSDEARADLLLGVDVGTLSAWLSLQDGATVEDLLSGTPSSLRTSVAATSNFPSRAHQLALAQRGRADLAHGFQRQLSRAGVPFEDVVTETGGT